MQKIFLLLLAVVCASNALRCKGGNKLRNGDVVCNESNNICKFSCKSFAVLIGPQVRSCDPKSKKWNDTMPICDADLSKCKQVIDGVKVKCPKYTEKEIDLLNSYYDRFHTIDDSSTLSEIEMADSSPIGHRSALGGCYQSFCKSFCWRIKSKKVRRKCQKCKKTTLKRKCVKSASLFG